MQYFTENVFDLCEEQYFVSYDFFQEELDAAPTMNTTVASDSSFSVSPFQIELSPIQLPTFPGEATKWVSFQDLFTLLIITPMHLSDTQHLHYLLNCVRDEATKLISYIRINDANFKVA